MNAFDVIIVGAGVAGMSVAHRLHQCNPDWKVAMLTLLPPGQAGATPWAQGGVAVAWGRDDSPALHSEDTLAAGAGLCRGEAVDVLTREGPERIQDLLDLGAAFDRDASGELELTREAAHQRRRVVHAGDASGRELARTLARTLPPTVRVLQGQVTRILMRRDRVVGVQLDGEVCLSAAHVVLASGGVGQLFAATTNPQGADGQGLGLAYEVGAHLRDLEFVQFHPTALDVPKGNSLPLLTEALRGEGARLLDETGRPFMVDYHPSAELAPRDVVAFALWQHRQKGHKTFLDARHLPVQQRFGQVFQILQEAGLDPLTDLLPVTPAVHYHMGGIAVDLWGRTNVDGLWACGEVSSTGVHGANRLASNSLLEGLVFGHRIGQALAESGLPSPGPLPRVEKRVPQADPLVMARVREILWSGLGLARSSQGLEKALASLERLRSRLLAGGSQTYTVAHLMLQSARFRQESRGAHRRLDYPQLSSAWEGHTLVRPGQVPCLQALTGAQGIPSHDLLVRSM